MLTKNTPFLGFSRISEARVYLICIGTKLEWEHIPLNYKHNYQKRGIGMKDEWCIGKPSVESSWEWGGLGHWLYHHLWKSEDLNLDVRASMTGNPGHRKWQFIIVLAWKYPLFLKNANSCPASNLPPPYFRVIWNIHGAINGHELGDWVNWSQKVIISSYKGLFGS